MLFLRAAAAAPHGHRLEHAHLGPAFFPRAETHTEATQHLVTELSVLVCAVLVAICRLGGQATSPKQHRGWMLVALVVWYWTTTTWAADTKRILNAYQDRSDPQYPLVAFWATFLPQLFGAVVLTATVGSREGLQHVLPSRGQLALWVCSGAAFWYGQFYTVESLIHGTPALTFVVKAVEPLTTAVLAIPILGQSPSLPLLLGICIACAGVAMVVTSSGTHGSGAPNVVGMEQLAGIGFAALANLGFSSRACLAKLALSKLRLDPFVAFTKMTVVGAQVGVLPGLAWIAAGSLGIGGVRLQGTLGLLDSRFELATWLSMCLSYLLYQACSILILSSIAVESHALLVAMKHVTVVVTASILVHAHLTVQAAMGTAVACGGVLIYLQSAQERGEGGGAAGKALEEAGEASIAAALRVAEDQSLIQKVPSDPPAPVPWMLVGLVAALAMGGVATPILTSTLRS